MTYIAKLGLRIVCLFDLTGPVAQCTLVRNSTKLESRVDFAGATIVGPIRKLNRSNKSRGMCADTIAQTGDSLQKFSYVGETGANCYNFKLNSLFVKNMLDSLLSVNVYIKFIIRVNKMYHTIDIPYCS